MNAKSVYASFATMDNEKEVSFDLNGLDKLIAELRTLAKDKRVAMKDILDKEKAVAKEDAAKVGKDFYNKLKLNDEFEILIGGKAVLVKKIAVKAKVSNSAACAIVGWKDDGTMGKTANRYLGFDKVVVDNRFDEPTDEVEEPTLE